MAATSKSTQQATSSFPIIYSFTIDEIDLIVLEVEKDKKWLLKAPTLDLAAVNVTAKPRTLFELFLRKPNTIPLIGGYSAYQKQGASIILAQEELDQQEDQIAAGQPVTKPRSYEEMLGSWNSDSFAVYIGHIRDWVYEASGLDRESCPYSNFLDCDEIRTLSYYVWRPHTTSYYLARDFRLKSVEAAKFRDEAEKRVGLLITNVIDAHKDLDKFFFEIPDKGTRLHFFEMTEENGYGRPTFPLKVKDDQKSAPNRGLETLLNIRKAEKIEKRTSHFVYPGLIYRLLSAGSNWVLGKTVYTDLIESCDYLNFKIKSGWYKAEQKGGHLEALEFLKEDEVVQEWANLARGILNGGRFYDYLAGLAFSLPIFQIGKNKELKLLMAEGSSLKMADYGMHVAPAGMLEFSPGDAGARELDLSAFQTILAKELAEETLVGKNFSAIDDQYKRLFSVMESGPHNFGDPFRAKIVRSLFEEDILPNWDNIWKDKTKIPAQTPLRGALCLNPNIHPSFWIVDSFALRPEIIMPLYIIEDLSSTLNWEYKPGTQISQTFSSFAGVLDYVLANRNHWCAPGLASLYFGAQLYFSKLEKGEEESLLVTNLEGYGKSS
ncbi:MAG: hypothetical protein LBE80_02495 [Deltaproteobacteria bacterium]|jgi:hypothetical protein|nr:hypothetical protein [Deltaproteobacteria bacterium]